MLHSILRWGNRTGEGRRRVPCRRRKHGVTLTVECLEAREVPSLAVPIPAAFAPIKINAAANVGNPAVAMAGNGDFVTVQPDASNHTIEYNLFNSLLQGTGPIQANTSAGTTLSNSSVAIDAAGDLFVVAWDNNSGTDTVRLQLFKRTASTSGPGTITAAGGEVTVNAPSSFLGVPQVAMDASGNFVVVYQDRVGANMGILAQRFNNGGSAQGAPITVANGIPFGSLKAFAVDMNAGGAFAVDWVDQTAGVANLHYEAFDPANALVLGPGAIGLANNTNVTTVDVGMDNSGNVELLYENDPDVVANNGVFVQRVQSSGVLLAAVPLFTNSSQFTDGFALAVDHTVPVGNFVVAYDQNLSGKDQIFATRFDPAGTLLQGPFNVNNPSTQDGGFVSVGLRDDTNFAVAWNQISGTRPNFVQAYVPDTTTVNSITPVGATTTNAATVSWTVGFANVVGNVTASNFQLVPGGGLGGAPAIQSVTPVGGSTGSSQWLVTATTGTGSGTLGLDVTGNGSITPPTQVTNTLSGPVFTLLQVVLSPTALPAAVAGAAYSQTITAGGGTAPYTFAVTAGSLPAGLTLNAGGLLSGTTTTAGSFAFTVTATDSSGPPGPFTGSQNYVLSVNAAATSQILVSAPATATAGSAFTFTVTARDAFNNIAPSYAGTVHFTSTDIAATLPANTTLANGVGTFNATLVTLGNQTITATDTVTPFLTGTSNLITVGAGAATHFQVNAPASATAGTAFPITVTALDAFNNIDNNYTGTVHFTSTDNGAGLALPADYSFTTGIGNDNGVHTFLGGVTLVTAGNQTITAADTVTAAITGTSNLIAVKAAAATHFKVSAPASATAGTPFLFTVTALDAFNNTDTNYLGTVQFTSSDGTATLPAISALVNGVGTFNATLTLAGNQTITATDTVTPGITGTSNLIAVKAAAATHFKVSAPANATAGTAFSYTVTALDAFNNTDTNYAGTIQFTSSDGTATLPPTSTLVNGVGTFSATLTLAGNQTITATDTVTPGVNGASNLIAVRAAAATHFLVSAPATATAGTAFPITVTALDPFGNIDSNYSGTVHFTSTDNGAGLAIPADYSFTTGNGADNGVHTFLGGVTLVTAGNQTITAADTVTAAITGTSNLILVKAAAATHFSVSAPASVAAGTGFNYTVTALDPFNNIDNTYAGTVQFTSSDSTATLPANSTLVGGVGTFSATLTTAGNQTITATDTVTPGITGTSNLIAVLAGSATHFGVIAPASATAGTAFSYTVTALDGFNNTDTNYAGTIQFTSSDVTATLPGVSTLTNGVGSFNATLTLAGNQTITATDVVSTDINGTSNLIAVKAAAATHFVVNAPGAATAGVPFLFTVTALDPFNNTDTNYAGIVFFTSSDGGATLPANSTLVNGVGTFNATLTTAGNQTITATDTVAAGITGVSNLIAVGAAAATHFLVVAPGAATASVSFNFTVTAQDAFNNTATSYMGTVQFTSSDAAATLPGNSTLINGVGTLSAVLQTLGLQTITATDTIAIGITGTSNPIVVSGPATHYLVTAPATAVAGTAFNFTVTALDALNNTATGYAGTAHFTSSDGAATLPANSTLVNGVGTFSATMQTIGTQTITATDTLLGSNITGTSGPIVVSAPPPPAPGNPPASPPPGNSPTPPVVPVSNPAVVATVLPSVNPFDSVPLRVLQALQSNPNTPPTTEEAILDELRRRRQQFVFIPDLPKFFLPPGAFRPLIFDRALGSETFVLLPNDPKAGAISGIIFEDYEGTGIRDNTKPPQPGVVVFVDLNNNGVLDYGEPTAITNHMGEYRFVGMKPGSYTIRQVLRNQVVQTYPPRGGQHVKLLEHEVISEVNFGSARVRQRRRPLRSSSNQIEPRPTGFQGSDQEPARVSRNGAPDRDTAANAAGSFAEFQAEPASPKQTRGMSWSHWIGTGAAWVAWVWIMHFRPTPGRSDEIGPAN